MLLVVLKAKGPVDRPVVGDGDTAPLAVVVVGGGEGSLVLAGEAATPSRGGAQSAGPVAGG